MANQSKKWIVRDNVGHIYGPFELIKLRDLITRGILTGEEDVAHYPAGDWAKMSADPEIYNILMDALTSTENPKSSRNEKPMPKPQHKKKEKKERNIDPTMIEVAVGMAPKKKTSEIPKGRGDKQATTPLTSVKTPPIIELMDKKFLQRWTWLRVNSIPIILIIAAVALLYLGQAYHRSAGRSVAMNLINPHPKKNIDANKSQALVKEGMGYFYKDTYTNYIRAEELFVEAVEESYENTEAIKMLILTDLELWPFSKQDGADQDTIQNLMQMISKVDRIGTKRSVASPAAELALGHDVAARSQADSALVTQPAEGFLYSIKGQTYFDSGDYSEAENYYEQAASLIPQWVKPFFILGLSFSKQGSGPQAQDYLTKALKMNPSHAQARLELGVVESRYFNHDDKAREFLTVALDGEEKILGELEVQGRLTLASILARVGDRDGAKKQALLAAQISPTDPDVIEILGRLGEKTTVTQTGNNLEHMALGDQYMRTSNYLAAQAQYKAAFQIDPHNARAAMKVAEALWKLHQSSEAISYLQKSISADPKFIQSYVLLADYKSQRYDFEGAARALEMAMKKNSKSYDVFRGYGEIALRRGDLPGAEAYVNRALQYYEIDLRSNELMSKIMLGRKDLIKALQYAKKAIEIDSGDAGAQVNYAKVIGAYEGVKAASDYLRELIALYPNQTELRVGLGEILMADEQYDLGKQILKQVVSVDESNKEAYLLLGDAESAQGNLTQSLGNYLSAARIDPSDPTALFRTGEVYLNAGRTQEAQKQFQLVLRVNPLYPRVHYNLARAYFTQGYADEALKELDQEKKMNPRLADPYEFAGDILLATRKFTGAVREYQKASEFRSNGAAIYVKLAKAYKGQGSYDAAMAMLRLAAAKESGYSEIYKEYGYIYDAKGSAPEAIANFERYLNLEPAASDREVIQQKIKQLQ